MRMGIDVLVSVLTFGLDECSLVFRRGRPVYESYFRLLDREPDELLGA